jgi:hypothetical protein
MEYRFPSAMGEAHAAGWNLNPDWLGDVLAQVRVLMPAAHMNEFPSISLVEVILLAVQKCPSGDFILHDANGNILREK